MGHFEEEHGEVGAVLDDAVAVGLSEVVAALREEVEGAVRLVDFKARNLLGEAHDQVLAAFESLAHLFNAGLVAGECGSRGHLAHRAGAAGVLPLKFAARLGDPFRRGGETDAPTCHGVSLRHAVHHHRPFFHPGAGGD